MHIAQKLRADLVKAGYTDISIRPSLFFIQAKNSEGNPVTMMISPDSVTALTEATQRSEFRQQFPAYGRKRQQRRSDAWTEFDRGCATCHARRRREDP